MKTLNYKTFKSNNEFVVWQEETGITSITSVSPIMVEMDIGMKELAKTSIESDVSGNAGLSHGVFVVYILGE